MGAAHKNKHGPRGVSERTAQAPRVKKYKTSTHAAAPRTRTRVAMTSVSPVGPRASLAGHSFVPPMQQRRAGDAGAPSAADSASDGAKMSPPTSSQLVLKALSIGLKATYRKANPDQPIGSDAAPRRVLTHPSLPSTNGCVARPRPQPCRVPQHLFLPDIIPLRRILT